MKSRLLIVALILVVLGASLWAVMRSNSQQVELVPAWRLTPQGMYNGDLLLDPVVSWSPNSKSLLVAAKSTKTTMPWILHWNVGDKQLERVCYGAAPNYIDNDTFLYLITNPQIVVEHSFSRGTDRPVIRSFERVDFWKDITSFSYVPARKTLALRFSTFTRYYEPGLVEVDLTGKPLGKLPRLTGDGILDRSADPENQQVAEILGELTGGERVLQVSQIGATSGGKRITDGDLGAVAWSPDGNTIAFADSNEVKIIDPAGLKITVVGRFGSSSDASQMPYVCRLAWSPDSKYLCAIQLVPTAIGGDMMAYVLDMSKLKR